MSTSDKKPPTWQCGNGHRQPWGEDAPVRQKHQRCLVCNDSRIIPGNGEYTTEPCPACKDADVRPAWIEAAGAECLRMCSATR
jgi:hypothetical protein